MLLSWSLFKNKADLRGSKLVTITQGFFPTVKYCVQDLIPDRSLHIEFETCEVSADPLHSLPLV